VSWPASEKQQTPRDKKETYWFINLTVKGMVAMGLLMAWINVLLSGGLDIDQTGELLLHEAATRGAAATGRERV
jgi:hypothetical protein